MYGHSTVVLALSPRFTLASAARLLSSVLPVDSNRATLPGAYCMTGLVLVSASFLNSPHSQTYRTRFDVAVLLMNILNPFCS